MTELVSAPNISTVGGLAADSVFPVTTAAGDTLYQTTGAEVAAFAGGGGNPWWFNPPVLADFPVSFGTAGVFTATDDPDAGLLIKQTDTYVSPARGVSKAIPTPGADWEAVMRMDFTATNVGAANQSMCAHNAAKDKFIVWGWDTRQAAHYMRYTATGYDGVEILRYMSAPCYWYKLAYNASTGEIFAYISATGKSWFLVAHEVISGYMGNPTNVGFFITTEGSNFGYEYAITYWADTL